VDAIKRMVRALNPALAGLEASCFDGRYITGDVFQADIEAMQVQRALAFGSGEEAADRGRLALQGSGGD
jgi:amidophosphoribosyltransferase